MTINITCRILFFIFAIICVRSEEDDHFMSKEERIALREEARKMFYHAYDAYMENAYPADELMPLSCTGRWKGITPSRGDMDDALGNFSLTLVDSLDTLVVMGDFAEFSRAIKLVIENVTFDSDIVVSVFETNIRVLGGLLSAHVLAKTLQCEVPVLEWYNDELLDMAEDLGNRLLPAFNTSTGIPHGRVNLRYGIQDMSDSRETCTACAGTMIMEMAALSRLTGNSIFEQKAHKAMDRLWKIRHRTSDLMGTVINIHSGDWVRKDSGVGAGIDSYYEYCLKAYILLGDKKYFNRFNRHYNAVMKYINRGPILLAVHMHRPQLQSRNFMDALLAFWPGLQVLLGDMRPAVETHEMLYQVMQRHTFIPEAFTPDLQVHWGQHPLRPEFLESTYFLHRATNDDYYLIVGKQVLKALQLFAKVPCGYAAVNDVRTRVHEDRMDSFVLAETFKYLYMLFAEDKDLPINIEDYVLTTEAHFLPLSLATNGKNITHKVQLDDDEDKIKKVCPSTASIIAAEVREPLRALLSPKKRDSPVASLKPINEPRQLNALSELGISVVTLLDGRVQLLYAAVLAKSAKDAAEGLTFMKDIAKWNHINEKHNGVIPIGVKVGDVVLMGGPSTMGKEIAPKDRYRGRAVMVFPVEGCSPLNNPEEVEGRIAIARRGKCPFSRKAKNLQAAGASLMIILDNVPGTSKDNSPLFSMTNDVHDDIKIPSCFLFSLESSILMTALNTNPYMEIVVGEYNSMKDEYGEFCESGSCKATFESLPRDLTEAHASLRSKTKIRTRTEFEVNVSEDNKVSLIESSEREGKKTTADLEKDAHGQICVANDLLSDKISCREPDEPAAPGNPDEPAAPGNPDEPAAPGNPDEPAAPGNPDEPAAPGNPDDAVADADNQSPDGV